MRYNHGDRTSPFNVRFVADKFHIMLSFKGNITGVIGMLKSEVRSLFILTGNFGNGIGK
jgi:hypothetical protein